jgi:hypothetical protein
MFGKLSPDAKGVSEGARVDRMVKRIASSEKATGKSKKDAESIAWATVNKRGMLDNKNKKKGVKEDNLSDMRETKTAWLTPGKFSEEENQNANGEDEATRYLKQLRMRNPAAKSNLSALAFDYRQAQDRDHREINRLDHENDREDADIDRLDVENDHEDHEIDALKRTLDQLISNRNSK